MSTSPILPKARRRKSALPRKNLIRGACTSKKNKARRSVSRVLSPQARRSELAIDGYSSGTPVTERLMRHTRTTARKHACGLKSTGRPYSVLLPVGFTMPHPSPGARCALTAPFHPYPSSSKRGQAVCFLWHFPWGHPRRPLTGTVSPWSPDFPRHPKRVPQPSDRLAYCLSHGSNQRVKKAIFLAIQPFRGPACR